jgi:hypothetical protein
MIHTYSLIHDDLPAMDDDSLRRGLPTSHVRFGEGMAILAGDGLLTEAFTLLAREPAGVATDVGLRKLRTIEVIAEAAGAAGMVGGQAIDLHAARPHTWQDHVPEVAPFDAAALLDNDLLQLCDRWPATPVAPGFGPGPLPDVPTLILEGEDDLRTPVENGRRVAALFPRSQLVVSPDTGHSALGSDPLGCAERAFARFFADRSVITDCPRRRRRFPATPPPPRILRAVTPARGSAGVRGRALGALGLTLRDVAQDAFTRFGFEGGGQVARGGGLRAGRYRIELENTLHLHGVVFVPGVRVSGAVRRFAQRRQAGRLRLSGPASPAGTVRLRGRRISGRLAGQKVSAVLHAGPGARPVAARLRLPPPGRAGR